MCTADRPGYPSGLANERPVCSPVRAVTFDRPILVVPFVVAPCGHASTIALFQYPAMMFCVTGDEQAQGTNADHVPSGASFLHQHALVEAPV